MLMCSPHIHTAVTVDLVRDFGTGSGALRRWNEYWASVSRGTIFPTVDNALNLGIEAGNQGLGTVNGTFEPNVTLAPDGTMTGSRIKDNATNDAHLRYVSWVWDQTVGFYTHEIYVKADTKTYATVICGQYFTPFSTWEIIVDLTTGTITDTNVRPLPSSVTVDSIVTEDAGNGWWKVTGITTDNVRQGRVFLVGPANGPNIANYNYSGDGTGSIFVWKMEVKRTDAPYRPNGPVTLTIPAGNHGGTTGSILGDANALAFGGRGKVTIVGAGAESTFVQVASMWGIYAGTPDSDVPGPDAWPRIQTALAGSPSVTLADLAHVDQFIVGMWVELMCLDMQAGGYPQNNYFFEFRKITAIDSGTGEITFDDVLHHDYKLTYPSYGDADAGNATIFPMGVWFDAEVTLKGVTISNDIDTQMFGNLRKVLVTDCNFPGSPLDPTQSQSWIHRRMINSGKFIEVDKSVTYLEYTDCDLYRVQLQSAGSIEDVLFQGCTVEHITGGGTNTTILDTNITGTILFGCQSYGVSRTCVMDNCTVADVNLQIAGNRTALPGAAAITTINTSGTGLMTLTAADINSDDNRLMYVPGCKYFFAGGAGGNSVPPSFEILDMTDDISGNVYIQTNLSGTYPAITDGTASSIIPNTMPDLTVTNCTGCHQIEALSRAPAHHSKGSYYDSGVVSDGVLTPLQFNPIHGTFVSFECQVTKAYTGIKSDLRLAPYGFGGFAYPDHMHSGEVGPPNDRYAISIDLEAVGTTTILPTSSGGPSGTDGPGANQWIKSTMSPIYIDGGGNLYSHLNSEDITVRPEFRIIMVMEHGEND